MTDYVKKTWVDEVLAGAERYDIKDNGGTPVYSNMQIALATGVTIAGTPIAANAMNNIEDGFAQVDKEYTTGGSSTAFTFTTTGALALATGERWHLILNATAGATPSLNRDAKGAKSLMYYNDVGTKIACGASTLVSGMHIDVVYDGADYVVLRPVFLSPASATATPTASKIPIADSAGKLDGWVTSKIQNYMDNTIIDEFNSGLLTSGSIGNLGWVFLNTPTVTAKASADDHPGMINIATPASAAIVGISLNAGAVIGGLRIDNLKYCCFVVRPVTAFTASGSMRFGLLNSVVTGDTASGYYFSKVNADANWFAVKAVGGTPTRTDTGVPWTAGNWYVLEILHVDTNYLFYINGTLRATVAEDATINAFIGYFAFIVETTTTVARTIDADFFACQHKMVQRYT